MVRVAAVSPRVWVGDVEKNTIEAVRWAEKAVRDKVSLVVFPELSLTGYTAGDLFHQATLQRAAQTGLVRFAKRTSHLDAVFVVGLPLVVEGKLFNVGAVVSRGEVLGIVPKTYIPGYKEFYEERWFASARDLVSETVRLDDKEVPVGTKLLFRFTGNNHAVLAVEVCEDVWTPIPPSSHHVLAGATIVANLSASNDVVGKADYRRALVSQQSARGVCGYVYTSCGVGESTTDVVFGGHALIAENGALLSESKRFVQEGEMIISDIDLEHLMLDRIKTTSFGESVHEADVAGYRTITLPVSSGGVPRPLKRYVDAHPFVPQLGSELDKRSEEIVSLQAAGLARRLEHAKLKHLIIGVSGGLDSTLALLVAARAVVMVGRSRADIRAYTMPGFATSSRTRSNAELLCEALGVPLSTIPISDTVQKHLSDIGHDGETQDVTYENAQARYRTTVLMNEGNRIGGIVVGTGDLSEIALGWCTFTGDHISHYNVNASVPKTLVRHLVRWLSEQEDFKDACTVLADILDTPISPELTRAKKGEISQKTEDIVGPYELHDFFLYHFVRWGTAPDKILILAEEAFGTKYTREVIVKWLKVFVSRFFANQWKRSVAPDGPKVGSVSLSPRGDWRMPSDVGAEEWLRTLPGTKEDMHTQKKKPR